MSYRIINGQIHSIDPISIKEQSKARGSSNPQKSSFKIALENQIKLNEKVKISKHAQARLDERNIKIDDEDMIKIKSAIDKAKEKGASEGVILYKDYALIASFKNNTIITAMDKNDENIITNIDSVVLL
ncbi:TIGR02530 family flagellar biosynthesis protein [Clostridium cellulovorans]|uniref:Flagellar operon protein n=1 Tax=Clostridium cellulovorans (strain ATCC 35296 / DSM 3052 / OCM 3 / 743B) TaxID=573061 RepID=D9SKG9_CLOC7|nr:TIGR02530 family flagellar biosynthesis protein [Clostridium cellulovorans]ADL51465.1 flagellar operon protein [Clostridium cellulovorans 743B]